MTDEEKIDEVCKKLDPPCPGCGAVEGSNHNFDCPEAQD